MNEAWRIKKGILVSDNILIFSLFVGCIYHKGPALREAVEQAHVLATYYKSHENSKYLPILENENVFSMSNSE